MMKEQLTLDGSEYIEPTSDEWETPHSVFNPLNARFNFTLDVCCTEQTSKCDKYFTKDDNGLIQSWHKERVWMNPPYSEIPEWIEKAYKEVLLNDCKLVCMLLPAWTDRDWFHDWVIKPPYFNEYQIVQTSIEYIRGRVKFLLNGKTVKSPRFGSMVVIFK